jgi:hypothetical protein
MNNYLASLPANVTNEDVLNVQASNIKIFERSVIETFPKREPLVDFINSNKKIEVKEPTTEDKYKRNLHLFCMVEHERRNYLLLPEELINVTRRLHAKNKFDNVNEKY